MNGHATLTPARRDISLFVFLLAAVSVQMGAHLGLYWARVQTFTASPGRFAASERVLGSDAVVFALPILGGIGAILALLLRFRIRPLIALIASAALASAGTYVALLIAFNCWGT
jgi:hypothetical protein